MIYIFARIGSKDRWVVEADTEQQARKVVRSSGSYQKDIELVATKVVEGFSFKFQSLDIYRPEHVAG
ncbi:hypothetical protein GVN16_18345 [Emticicia sp. CRIBPO]|uniref:hypothetical protein n=1 Tax=Emticicia sp. CRIBPO TaxID=2683258 RepID=UPI001412B1B2|nr:hypothetical protein [Emticicia sp. CRIBPO]NBA87736.1 hypothetical protein [Emticicia sp. CRIBPO]